MKRREFIAGLGSAAAWPIAAHAQQPAMPVIGMLWGFRDRFFDAVLIPAFRKGLSETGYVEGQSVALEQRFAEGQNDRLQAMAADLVRRRVAIIFSHHRFARHSRPKLQPQPFQSFSGSVQTRFDTVL
jgi:putative ABC transport system substrate-binding protein